MSENFRPGSPLSEEMIRFILFGASGETSRDSSRKDSISDDLQDGYQILQREEPFRTPQSHTYSYRRKTP